MSTSGSPTPDAKAARTACAAVLVAIPGLFLTAIAALNANSLALNADFVLTLFDMIVLVAALVVAKRASRPGVAMASSKVPETAVCALAALCMMISMIFVAWVALQRILVGGLAPTGSGVILGLLVNGTYAVANCWILFRWKRRFREVPSAFARSQVCLFSDKLTTNVLVAASMGLALISGDAPFVRYVDPVAGILIVAATARWIAPVLQETFRGVLARKAAV